MPQEFVNDYSFGSVLKTERQEEKIVQELALPRKEAATQFVVQYAKAGEYAVTLIYKLDGIILYNRFQNCLTISKKNLLK